MNETGLREDRLTPTCYRRRMLRSLLQCCCSLTNVAVLQVQAYGQTVDRWYVKIGDGGKACLEGSTSCADKK